MSIDRPQRETRRENRDGRVARGERTRRAIVDAHTTLLREGELRPTAKLVAERAGISVRTLWLNFGDMEALLSATSAYWLDRDDSNWTPVDADLPLAERIDRWCTQRAARMEDLAPAAASSLLVEPFSDSLIAARREHGARLRCDLLHTFGEEVGPAASTSPTYLALLGISNSMTWQVLRHDQGLTLDEAADVMRHTFTALLATNR